MKKLICWIFGHTWRWSLSDVGGVIILDDPTIPDCAVCQRCGAKANETNKEKEITI